MTPDVACTLRVPEAGQAVDLSAIRRTDALIDLLASRRLRPRALGDPVIALLSSLISDVDAPGRGTAAGRGAHRRRGGRWVRALAAALAFAMGAVAAAGLLVVTTLARLTGAAGRGRTRL